MPRSKNAPKRKKSHKRTLKEARGYRGGRSKLYRTARESLIRSGAFARRDRRTKKRRFRRLWITRITSACKERGTSYSAFVDGLRKAEIALDRKVLSNLAIEDPPAFDRVVEEALAARS